MSFLRRLLLRPTPRPTLVVRIVATDDHVYHVQTDRVNAELGSAEYVRLVLHYYAQVLFAGTSSDERLEAATDLRTMMTRVCARPLSGTSDVLAAAGLDTAVGLTTVRPQGAHHEITAALHFVSLSHRELTATFSRHITTRHIVLSVFVLMQACLPHLTPADLAMLRTALRNMQRMYDAGYEPSDSRNLSLVPNEAVGIP